MSNPDTQLETGQRQSMTPELLHAIRLLKLPAGELQALVQRALDSNVMLETDEAFDTTWVLDATSDVEQATRGSGSHDSGGTLHEHLAWQLDLAPLPNGPRAIGRALIDAIDADGFLTATTGAIVERVAGAVRADAGVVESVLAIIQQFDPAGVGARSVSECIGLQLARLESGTPGLEAARRIARHHLALVTNQQFEDLQRLTGYCGSDLESAVALVRSCDQRPGAVFQPMRSEYAVPDAFARRTPEAWTVELNPAAVPRVRLNERYAAMVTSPAEFALLRAQSQEARWLAQSLEIRNDIVLGVARAIVNRHADFLERSDESVQPMTMLELAEAIGMHESTVARVTAGKYLQTPRGVFEFRFFCTSLAPAVSYHGSTGTWLSSVRIQPAAG